MTKLAETDVAQAVSQYLLDLGWDVYPEVQVRSYENRADLVGLLRDPTRTWVVCCKTSMGLAVCEQAAAWIGFANYVSVAYHSGKVGRFLTNALKEQGIGALLVRPLWGDDDELDVAEVISPALNRRVYDKLSAALCEGHKIRGVAGSKHDYHTPFRETIDELRRVVANQPGLTLREAVAILRHHYASDSTAISCLSKWIREGKVTSLRVEGKPLRLYERS